MSYISDLHVGLSNYTPDAVQADVYSAPPAPPAPSSAMRTQITTDLPVSASAVETTADLFRRALTESPIYTNTAGQVRFESFSEILQDFRIEISPEERDVLIEIFSRYKSQALDQPIQILMLSLNKDMQKALDQADTADKIKKIPILTKMLANMCIEFANETRYQNFLSSSGNSNDAFIKKFKKNLTTVQREIEKCVPPSLFAKTKTKIALWGKLLDSPHYLSFAMAKFSTPDSVVHEDDGKSAFSTTFSLAAIHRIDADCSDFLSESEMIDFLIEHVDWLQKYHQPQNDHGDLNEGTLLAEIQPRLKTIKSLIVEDQLVKAKEERSLLISILSEKRGSIKAKSDKLMSSKNILRLFSLLRNDRNQFLVKAKEVVRFCEYDLLLEMLIVSLDTLIEKQHLMLMTRRLCSNLLAIQFIPQAIKNTGCIGELREDFLALCQKTIGLIPQNFKKKSILLIEKPFDGIQTPQELQTLCEKFGKCRLPLALTQQFGALQEKYSRMAISLHKLGRHEEAEEIEKNYSQLCISLAPIFFCIQDINNLRKEKLTDEDEIIPDAILDCFDLDTLPTDATVVTTSPDEDSAYVEDPTPSPDQQGPSTQVVPKDLSLPMFSVVPPSTAQPTAPHTTSGASAAAPANPVSKPRPVSPASSFDSPRFQKIPKNLNRRKLKKFLKEQFRAGLEEKTRHTGVVLDDGKTATLLTRSSKRDIPRGTLSGMNRALREAIQSSANEYS